MATPCRVTKCYVYVIFMPVPPVSAKNKVDFVYIDFQQPPTVNSKQLLLSPVVLRQSTHNKVVNKIFVHRVICNIPNVAILYKLQPYLWPLQVYGVLDPSKQLPAQSRAAMC